MIKDKNYKNNNMKININILWLITIILGSIILGFGICFLYILHTLKKTMGIKSWKDFHQQIKKNQELQKKMQKGNIGSMMEEINKNPHLKKQIEEFKKRFGEP